MNELSWLLYLANVCDSASTAAAVILTLGTIVLCIAGVLCAAVAGTTLEDEEKAALPAYWKFLKKIWALASVLVAVCVFVPSKNTMYAIAASQMGEQVLKSPTITKATQALDAWLDRQIAANAPAVAK